MNEPLHTSRVPTADLYLPDGAHLELQTDWHAGLGWWRVDGSERTRLTVAAAFAQAPRALQHEVLLEAQYLAYLTLQDHFREGGADQERHSAVETLTAEIHAARVALRDAPSMRRFGHDLADRLAG